MHFEFSDDHVLFRDSVATMLANECTPERLQALAASETGRSPELWSGLADLGLVGMVVPEAYGGLGLDEVALVLPLEETGRAALAEPLVETAAVAGPLLADCANEPVGARWLPEIAAGKAIATVGHPDNAFVADAHVADLLLLAHEGELHAVDRAAVALEAQPSVDPLRRLFRVDWEARAATRIANGDDARRLLDTAFDRGALATAAQQVGVARALVDKAVSYACTREQFGQPIGAFQAIKHRLADVAVRIEFARPVLYRAAFALAHGHGERRLAVSHAKAAASEAARLAAKTALQVHGAIGYTWEVDLHLWMKRAWSLDLAWGSAAFHRARIAERILDDTRPAPSFGFEPRTGD